MDEYLSLCIILELNLNREMYYYVHDACARVGGILLELCSFWELACFGYRLTLHGGYVEMLLEDRMKRENEFVEERKSGNRKEKKDREIQEREVAKQMDAMCSHLQGLAKLVEVTQKAVAETMAAVGKVSPKELHVKLVAIMEKDDAEAYLVTFERIMQVYKVDEAYWTYYSFPQLSGRAQQALFRGGGSGGARGL